MHRTMTASIWHTCSKNINWFPKTIFIFSIFVFVLYLLLWIGIYASSLIPTHLIWFNIFFKNKFYFREQYISSRTFTRSLTQVKLIGIHTHMQLIVEQLMKTIRCIGQRSSSNSTVRFAIRAICYVPIAIHLILFCVCVHSAYVDDGVQITVLCRMDWTDLTSLYSLISVINFTLIFIH